MKSNQEVCCSVCTITVMLRPAADRLDLGKNYWLNLFFLFLSVEVVLKFCRPIDAGAGHARRYVEPSRWRGVPRAWRQGTERLYYLIFRFDPWRRRRRRGWLYIHS